jgi:thioredoxin 1
MKSLTKENHMANIIEITVDNFDTEVLKAGVPVLVDFWAPWCGPCRAVAPMLETINQELQGKVKFVKVNVDDHQQLAVRFGVQAIPTLIIFKNGQAVDRIVGMIPREQISSHLQAQL